MSVAAKRAAASRTGAARNSAFAMCLAVRTERIREWRGMSSDKVSPRYEQVTLSMAGCDAAKGLAESGGEGASSARARRRAVRTDVQGGAADAHEARVRLACRNDGMLFFIGAVILPFSHNYRGKERGEASEK